MDSNFFRFFLEEIGPLLKGRQLGKIYQPDLKVWTIQCGSKEYLILHTSKKSGALFLSSLKPHNPEKPSVQAKWWRKRLAKRYIEDYVSNWPDRQVAFKLSSGEGSWLLVDIVKGLYLLDSLDKQFGLEPKWPALEEIGNIEESYKVYPQFSPPLRQTLKSLSYQEGEDLLEEVKKGRPDSYHLCASDNLKLTLYSWPIPSSWSSEIKCDHFSSAQEAAFYYGWQVIHQEMSLQKQEQREEQKRIKKLHRKLERVEEDQSKLRDWLDLRDWADILQMNLHQLDYNQRTSELGLEDWTGKNYKIQLDPTLTVLENMHQWYKKARKANRGLKILQDRRKILKEELAEQDQINGSDHNISPVIEQGRSVGDSKKDRISRWQGLQVRVYKSSDHYIILRGKNQRANHKLLSNVAKPFDFWFHVKYGSGAHVILQRDNEMQTVPRTSKSQAAVLAGLASDHSLDSKADILCALVRDVRKIKGAALGEVRVDKIQETMRVTLDSQLEKSLRLQ